MTDQKLRILVIDDEPGMRKLMAYFLGANGYEITVAANGDEGIEQLKKASFDLVLTDYKMPGKDGTRVLNELFGLRPGAKAILMTGMVEEPVSAMERKWGVTVLQKPFEMPALLKTVQTILG